MYTYLTWRLITLYAPGPILLLFDSVWTWCSCWWGFCKTMPEGNLGPGGTSGVRVRLALRRRRNVEDKVYQCVYMCVYEREANLNP